MARSRVDPSLERHVENNFSFPLGVYPVEPMDPKPGYSVEFEPADGTSPDDEPPPPSDSDDPNAEFEEWPDRYRYEIVITAERLEPFVRAILSIMPGRVYPILDVLGQDAYREVDPYIAYELVGMERVTDALRRFRGMFFEDGLVGFGCMVEEPFLYMFVDEHKIVTLRVEPDLRDKVEKLLKAFDLEQSEEVAGADAVSHEHRTVLMTEEARPELLNVDEIVEFLRDEWRLTINIDPETNLDDDGKPLGVTGWRCLLRAAAETDERPRYAEVVLAAGSMREAEDIALDALEDLKPTDVIAWDEALVVQADRVDEAQLADIARHCHFTIPTPPLEPGIYFKGWLE